MEATLTITDVAYRGMGVARLEDGRVVFVPHTLAGERVKARLTRLRTNYAAAILLEVLEPAAARLPPACPLADACPGCCYQHAAYAEEVRCKQRQFARFIARVGAPEGALEAPVAAPHPLAYRNKLVLHAQREGAHLRLGYVAGDNTTVLDVARCPLALDPLNARLAALRADTAYLAALDPQAPVTLRYTAADGALAWSGRPPPAAPWLTEQSVLGPLAVPRAGFFQVNPPVADALVSAVRERLRELRPARVLDLYGGVGVFALAAAQAGVPAVHGIEADAEAVRAATHNAAALGLTGVTLAAGQAGALARRALRSLAGGGAVIVDPPRRGLEPAVTAALATARPAHILYVACAPDMLARDVDRLRAAGYAVRSARLFDMFPRTPYFESLTWLERG